MRCPGCGKEAVLQNSKIIYGRSYGLVWMCPSYPACKHYVGCHKGTNKPLGFLCDEETRRMRRIAHTAFDRIWKKKVLSRRTAYKRLAEAFEKDSIHIGESDSGTCQAIISWAQQFRKELP